MKLFDPEGPVMVALGKLADLVFCNVLFLLCSLPVFTMGASLAALYDCTLRISADTEEQIIVLQFLRAFRRDFKTATKLWLICLGAIALLTGYRFAVSAMAGELQRVYRVTFWFLAFVFLAGFQYIFPLQARYEMGVKAILKNAWLLALAALPWTLCALLVPAAAIYVSFFMQPEAANIFFFLWVFVVPAVIAYLDSFFYRKAFQKLPRSQ